MHPRSSLWTASREAIRGWSRRRPGYRRSLTSLGLQPQGHKKCRLAADVKQPGIIVGSSSSSASTSTDHCAMTLMLSGRGALKAEQVSSFEKQREDSLTASGGNRNFGSEILGNWQNKPSGCRPVANDENESEEKIRHFCAGHFGSGHSSTFARL